MYLPSICFFGGSEMGGDGGHLETYKGQSSCVGAGHADITEITALHCIKPNNGELDKRR
jgi:hypothetical protein